MTVNQRVKQFFYPAADSLGILQTGSGQIRFRLKSIGRRIYTDGTARIQIQKDSLQIGSADIHADAKPGGSIRFLHFHIHISSFPGKCPQTGIGDAAAYGIPRRIQFSIREV
jgi:hypothetical protein